MPDIDIFSEDSVEVLNINAREVYPEILPILPGENPFDVDPEDEEEASVDYGDVIDYGEYDLRNPPAVEPELEYVSDVLQNSPYIGVPINAFRVLLGSYTFAYGAKTDISVTTSQVIVKFPVVNRDGSLKQTTGAGDTEYEWEGHIKVNDVHKDLEAVKKIEALGEPVDFYYMSQKKKVLVESFDYKIIDNCNATYKIKVTEYYPQKIKAIPVRIDPLFPDRWGFIPPLLPGDDSDDENRQECNCSMSVSWTGEVRCIPVGEFNRLKFNDGSISNPVLQAKELLGNSLDNFITKWFNIWNIDSTETMQRIIDYMTFLLLQSQSKNIACVQFLFQECPKLQEIFYETHVLASLIVGAFYRQGREEYNLFFYGEDGQLRAGHPGEPTEVMKDLYQWFLENFASWNIPNDYASFSKFLIDASCSGVADVIGTLVPGVAKVSVEERCKAFKANARRKNILPGYKIGSRPRTIESMLQAIARGTNPLNSYVCFRIPQLNLSQGCLEWCDKNIAARTS